MKKIILSLSLAFVALLSNAQNGLDSIIVEKYYVSTAADFDATDTAAEGVLPIGSVTYRVFVSLKPGFVFQALYGSSTHSLIIKTSSPDFFNNKDRGAQYADMITRTSYLNSYSVALDSWFSIGAAVNGQFGVLKSKDDGATNYLFPHNPAGMLSNTLAPVGIPLSVQDGIISGGAKVPLRTNAFGDADTIAQNVFGGTGTGNLFLSRNGSIDVTLLSNNGTTGPPDDSTRVLVGQFTTDGVFEFELNVQIMDSLGIVQQFVARNPTGNEVSIPSLIYRSLTTVMSAPTFVLKDSLAPLRVNPTGNGSIDSVEFFVDGTKVGKDGTFPYSCNWKATALGTYTLTSITTEHDGTRITSSPITITVTYSFPTISIVSPLNGAEFLPDSIVAITTNVSESGNGALDSVEFFMNGVKIGTDVSSPYTYTYTTTINGTYTLTAVATDNKSVQATSSPITIMFGTKFPPAVSITSPATTSSYAPGDTVYINATASEIGGAIDSVLFFVNGTKIGKDPTAPYSFKWTSNTTGTYILTAMAFDANLVDTTSQPVIIGVKGPIITGITSPNSSYSYQLLADSIISITASASEAGGAIDSVVFFADGVRIGKDSAPAYSTGSTSFYTINWTVPTLDTYTLTVMTFDSTIGHTTSSPTVIKVVLDPIINISSPVSAATYTIGSTVSIHADASAPGDSINDVAFLIDGNLIGYSYSYPYTNAWTANAAGTYTLTAIAYSYYDHLQTISLPVIIVVKDPTTIRITAPDSSAIYKAGSMVSIIANASETGDAIDSVAFFVNGVKIGNDSSFPYSVNWTSNVAGTYTLTAVAYDSIGFHTTSSVVLISVTALTDITEITATTICEFYPNPANDFITIEITALKQSSNVSYSVCDIIGNVLLTKKIGSITGTYKEVLDVSSFSKGVFIIKMVFDELTITKKIIIN